MFGVTLNHSLISANDAGFFKEEITPLKLKTRKGEATFDVDEHPRVTEPQDLAALPSVFQKDGLVTAGNASVGFPSSSCCHQCFLNFFFEMRGKGFRLPFEKEKANKKKKNYIIF